MLSPLTKNAIDHGDRISIFKNLASHQRRKAAATSPVSRAGFLVADDDREEFD